MGFKSGFVAILGRPNVGKSTFLNKAVGQKVAIVSPKPQTTRKSIKGILNRPDSQIIFVDTPGLHNPVDSLGEFMIKELQNALEGIDLLLYMTTPEEGWKEDIHYLDQLKNFTNPKFLVINKKDLATEEKILEIVDFLSHQAPFAESLAISALSGEGVSELIEKITDYLPEGEPYYEPGIVSDAYEREIVAEIIREKIWWNVHQEVPYGVEVRVEEFKDRGEIIYIQATIYVERDSHKKIIIGEGGRMIKKIGQEAREEIEYNWGKKVYLDLWVKTEKSWRKRPEVLRRWGYKIK